MGGFLHAEFGAEHVVVGFAFNQGVVGLYGGRSISFGPAPEGYFDAALARTGFPLFALDLTRVPTHGPIAAWMAGKPLRRQIGGGGADYPQWTDPRESFDVMLFVETASATRGNLWPPRRSDASIGSNNQPTNLSLTSSGAAPAGWRLMDDGLYPYLAMPSDVRSPAGAATVRIARKDSLLPWGDGWLTQSFPADRWRGRQLVFSAAMMTEASRLGIGAYLIAQVYLKQRELAHNEMPAARPLAVQGGGPVRSAEWTRRAVSIDVPADAERIAISLVVTGNSVAWFGDLALDVADLAR